MSRNIIYIINPISGTHPKKNLHQLIKEKTEKEGISFRVIPSVADGNYKFLSSVIQSEKVTDVVIAGGDGTISQVVGSLRHEPVNFGIIPSGSGNGLALAAKISRRPEPALETIFHCNTLPTDGFLVNNHFACMLAGIGFDARVAHDFTNAPKRGLVTYARLAIRNFFSMKAFPLAIEIENRKLETEVFFISIANSNQFGNNFTIAPKASLSDGLLDIVIVTGQNKVNFILQTLKQLAGWNKLQTSSLVRNKKGVIYFQADRLKIYNPAAALLHIDGEPALTEKEIEIRVLKKCFRLIQPVQ